MTISCTVNGERRQHSNTSDMIFGSRQMISYVSRHIGLAAGDVIYTRTPEGVVWGRPPPAQRWLQPGNEVTVAIDGLGELTTLLI